MLMVLMRHSPDLQASVFAGQTWINLPHRLQPHPPSFVKIISHLNQEESLEILDSCVAANILNRSFRRMNHCS